MILHYRARNRPWLESRVKEERRRARTKLDESPLVPAFKDMKRKMVMETEKRQEKDEKGETWTRIANL